MSCCCLDCCPLQAQSELDRRMGAAAGLQKEVRSVQSCLCAELNINHSRVQREHNARLPALHGASWGCFGGSVRGCCRRHAWVVVPECCCAGLQVSALQEEVSAAEARKAEAQSSLAPIAAAAAEGAPNTATAHSLRVVRCLLQLHSCPHRARIVFAFMMASLDKL